MLVYFARVFAFLSGVLGRTWKWLMDRPIYVRKSDSVDDFLFVPRNSDARQVLLVKLERGRKKWWA